MKKLTHAYLKRVLFYNPGTGIFVWRVGRKGKARKGAIAGYINQGYRRIGINHKKYKASRLAFLYMVGKFPKKRVDHKNRIRDDDRWSNLREVSPLGNSRNHSLLVTNTSGTSGVSWCKSKRRWRVIIGANNKRTRLGAFKKKQEAIQIRQEAEKRYGYLEEA